jgi:hypothetical protein
MQLCIRLRSQYSHVPDILRMDGERLSDKIERPTNARQCPTSDIPITPDKRPTIHPTIQGSGTHALQPKQKQNLFLAPGANSARTFRESVANRREPVANLRELARTCANPRMRRESANASPTCPNLSRMRRKLSRILRESVQTESRTSANPSRICEYLRKITANLARMRVGGRCGVTRSYPFNEYGFNSVSAPHHSTNGTWIMEVFPTHGVARNASRHATPTHTPQSAPTPTGRSA